MNQLKRIYLLLGIIQGGYFALWLPKLIVRGFTLPQIAVLLSIEVALAALCELPTGFFADRLSHKWTTIAGLLLLGVGYLIPSLSATALALAAGIIVIGIGNAFVNGALDAWASHIQEAEHSHLAAHPFVRRDQIQRIGIILGSIAIPAMSTFVWKESACLTWATFLIPVFLLVSTAIRTTEPADSNQIAPHKSTAIFSELKELGTSRQFQLLVCGWVFLGVCVAATDLCFFPNLESTFHITSAFSFGLIQASISLGRIIGLETWKKFAKIEHPSIPGISLVASGALFFAYAMAGSASLALGIWLLRVMIMSIYFSVMSPLLFKEPLFKTKRATLLSVSAIASTVGQFLLNVSISTVNGISFAEISIIAGIASGVSGLLIYKAFSGAHQLVDTSIIRTLKH